MQPHEQCHHAAHSTRRESSLTARGCVGGRVGHGDQITGRWLRSAETARRVIRAADPSRLGA
ncbi:hypothetical protein CZ674_07620 [Agrococcus casei LMG 22410]|uniref:Uncharacterized protein n=1 Tax=Agrococcus casei LMG 22410 TaxID=1255656 RepID=A0A1R4G006_9MICO|nr:hypothetical protein CZ674_07620 [Agrococcus casei LMG 22410]